VYNPSQKLNLTNDQENCVACTGITLISEGI